MMRMDSSSTGWSDASWFERVALPADGGRWREFFSLKQSTGRNVMVAFNAGDAARYNAGLTDSDLVGQALDALNAMIPTFGRSAAT
jgi:hypothetical protein